MKYILFKIRPFLSFLFFKILDNSFYFILIFNISYIYLYNCLSTDIDFIILEMLWQCGIVCFSFFFILYYISFTRNAVRIYTLSWCFKYIFFVCFRFWRFHGFLFSLMLYLHWFFLYFALVINMVLFSWTNCVIKNKM